MGQLPDPIVRDWASIQRNFDAIRKRLDKLERGPVWITPVPLFNHGNGTVNGTSMSIAAHTGADKARIAIIRAAVGGSRTTAVYVTNFLTFRRAGVSGPLVTVYNTHGATTQGGSVVASQVFVPLDDTESFVYDRTDNMALASVFEAVLMGYYV